MSELMWQTCEMASRQMKPTALLISLGIGKRQNNLKAFILPKVQSREKETQETRGFKWQKRANVYTQ